MIRTLAPRGVTYRYRLLRVIGGDPAPDIGNPYAYVDVIAEYRTAAKADARLKECEKERPGTYAVQVGVLIWTSPDEAEDILRTFNDQDGTRLE